MKHNVFVYIAIFLVGVLSGKLAGQFEYNRHLVVIAESVGNYVIQQQRITNAVEITQPALTAIAAQKAKLIKE